MLIQIHLLHADGLREVLEQFTLGEENIEYLVDKIHEENPDRPHDSVFDLVTEKEEFFITICADPETPF